MTKHGREHHSKVAYTSGGGTWVELILPLDFESVDQNLSRYFPAQMRAGISARRERTETGIVRYSVNIPGCNEVSYGQRPPCLFLELLRLGHETRLIGTAAGREHERLRKFMAEIDAYLFPDAATTRDDAGLAAMSVADSDRRSSLAESGDYYSAFISHSSRDGEFVSLLHETLRESGVDSWYSQEHMHGKYPTRVTLDKAIWGQQKMLLVLSEHSIRSAWVAKEVETALRKEAEVKAGGSEELVVIAVRLDEACKNEKFGWVSDVYGSRYVNDFSKWREPDAFQRAFERLLNDLKAEGEDGVD